MNVRRLRGRKDGCREGEVVSLATGMGGDFPAQEEVGT
jgi:hypothetical protein